MSPTPRLTKAQATQALIREILVVVLAFVAGAGVYLAAVATDPLRLQDWAGAIAAGSTATLLRMFPSSSGRDNGRG